MLSTDQLLIVAAPEILDAFDRHTGVLVWQTSMSDTSGWTPMTVAGQVVVVAPPYEQIQAFDLTSGRAVPVPQGVASSFPPPPQLPDGYRFDGTTLRYHGQRIWKGIASTAFVRRVGSLTVVDDFAKGLAVVDDGGDVIDAPAFERHGDNQLVIVDGSTAFAAGGDDKLYAIAGR
jgi:hypothetical protein